MIMRRVRPIVIAGWFSATTVFAERINQEGRILGPLPVVTNFTKEEKAVLLGLKKYGAMVADNGNFFSISVTPDDRWPQGCFDNLTSVSITNFEVIQTTGPNEGPRSPGAPTASAGPDRSVLPGYPLPLQGVVNFTGAPPVIQWKLYLGPGPVAFGNANQTNTTATFTVPGVYTLMLSADDAVHSVAFDAVVVTVSTSLSLDATRTATNLALNWTAGFSNYVLQQTAALPASAWSDVVTTATPGVSIPITNTNRYFRVHSK